jgi:hypothetical protein
MCTQDFLTNMAEHTVEEKKSTLVHQKVSRFFEPRYIIGDDFFLGPNLVSFNRAVVPLFELSFLAKSQKLTSA